MNLKELTLIFTELVFLFLQSTEFDFVAFNFIQRVLFSTFAFLYFSTNEV